MSRFSGGGVYHYPNFHYEPERHPPESGDAGGQQQPQQTRKLAPHEMCDYVEVESLRKDLLRYLTRKIGFEAVLRLRCTRGLAVQVILCSSLFKAVVVSKFVFYRISCSK